MNTRFILRSQWISCILVCFFLSNCISENYEDCEPTGSALDFSLQFIYDYNEQRVDLFEKEVEYIDIYLFNEERKFIQRSGIYVSELTDNMLAMDLPEGTYTAVIWGNTHAPQFYLPDDQDLESISELYLSLNAEDDVVNSELPTLFHGKETFTIEDKEGKQICPVHLSRNTKIVRFVFSGMQYPIYTLGEINQQVVLAGTNGEYSYDNQTEDSERTILYMPVSETPSNRNYDLLVTFHTLQIRENTPLLVRLWDTRTELQPILEEDLLPHLLKNTEPEDVSEYLKYTHEFTLELELEEIEGGYVVTRIEPINWSEIHEGWEVITPPGEI
ncbi:MAG: FimB/Mfa2 family fimbrial subunit [Bacteroides sp.]|nr:FimB/Mfa2 family fimbrial subunit [Bacteroides sp.]